MANEVLIPPTWKDATRESLNAQGWVEKDITELYSIREAYERLQNRVANTRHSTIDGPLANHVFIVTGMLGISALITSALHERLPISNGSLIAPMCAQCLLLYLFQIHSFVDSLSPTVTSLKYKEHATSNAILFATVAWVITQFCYPLFQLPLGAEMAPLLLCSVTALMCTSFLWFFLRLWIFQLQVNVINRKYLNIYERFTNLADGALNSSMNT